MNSNEALVVFIKKPEPGKTKTRLSPALTFKEAAELYTCFFMDVVETASQTKSVDLFLIFDPPEASDYFSSLAPGFFKTVQEGETLGERMSNAYVGLFSQGYQRVVLIGSDLPHLSLNILEQSFQFLRQGYQAVIGPSQDGGYYLIGLIQYHPDIFKLPMSTPEVLNQTIERIQQAGLRLALLPYNFDIDAIEDLEKLKVLLDDDPSIPARQTRLWFSDWLKAMV